MWQCRDPGCVAAEQEVWAAEEGIGQSHSKDNIPNSICVMDLSQEQKADVVIYLFRFYHPKALFDILTAQSIFLLLPKHALYGNR